MLVFKNVYTLAEILNNFEYHHLQNDFYLKTNACGFIVLFFSAFNSPFVTNVDTLFCLNQHCL